MVASGLPRQNVEGHASEMAAMALEVRTKLSVMTVPHLVGESLRMRIGMNSGRERRWGGRGHDRDELR